MNRAERRAWLRAVRSDPNIPAHVVPVAAVLAAAANSAGAFVVTDDGDIVPLADEVTKR